MSNQDTISPGEIGELIATAKRLAKRYRELTGRTMGITGEVSEFEAARLLDLNIAPALQAGYDAIRRNGPTEQRLQIKGRCIVSKNPGQRLGRIDLNKEWDGVLLVLLDIDLEPTAIFEADRATVESVLRAPGSKARNERGAMSVSKFRSIARKVWPLKD